MRIPIGQSHRRQPRMSYPQIVLVFHLWKTLVDNSVDNPGQSYFHCVETPNPAAMKPKPTTMFQLPRASMGSEPSVT
ncbi:hypothetical protein SO3561_05644 [Streptomyces olivochromogenes]|uniref:Uncharacterized protein n=1 Tax=Streptomyces olivochromogenes TaxID=1963 RepID=A0A250VJ83_STROL|nr:hypothetical protein SO3561_05644 [Streptomyces olivochromogenes]